MRGEEDQAQLTKRLAELAKRADLLGSAVFTGFLSPPEAEWARLAAKKQNVALMLNGGYEEAERCMACFLPLGEQADSFPLTVLKLTWPHQSAPVHQDVLGSVMGLGLKRQCVGDIVIEADCAYLFVENGMGRHIADALVSAGRVRLQVEALSSLPALTPPEGAEVHDTVMSLRLDAVLSGGFGLSRTRAAELITAGQVKLRYLPTERTDARVEQGDVISARGFGRLALTAVGAPSKKGRIPLTLMRYGEKRGR